MQTNGTRPVEILELDDGPHAYRFSWQIRNFSRQPDKVYSNQFMCGGFKWYLNFVPQS